MQTTVGILGGMGPLATAKFYEKIVRHTPATNDQNHLICHIYSIPNIPDRTAYILDNTQESPLTKMRHYLTEMANQATVLVIPCITAMYFYPEIKDIGNLIYFPKIVLSQLIEQGHTRIGILSTKGTIKGKVFDTALTDLTHTQNVTLVYPTDILQAEMMALIYGIKAGQTPDVSQFDAIERYFKSQNVDVIILGCTELSLIAHQLTTREMCYVDALDILAQHVVKVSQIQKTC